MRELGSVRPLELFFDLVFVLAFTQCTTLMVADPSWAGIGRGVLALAVLWWAWVGYAWLTSVIEPEEGATRMAMFAVMAGLLVAALCVPEAFDERGVTFAVAYGVVRAGHIVLFVLSSREDRALRQSVAGLGVSSAAAVTVLLIASSVDGGAQALLWVLAIAVDAGGPALVGVAGWRLVPDHFAERHNLMIILALGESIVSLGVAAEVELTASVVVAAVLGVALASALWWIYFDVVALVTGQRLSAAAPGRERNSLARDSYSYLHFPMVAGIVVGALGLQEIVAHVDEHLDVEHATAVLGGTALYLLGHVALRLRNARTLDRHRLAVAVLLVLAIPVATHVRPLVVLGGVNALVWAMIAMETAHSGSTRHQLRHPVHPHGAGGPAQEQPA